jgi:hypothetical protein
VGGYANSMKLTVAWIVAVLVSGCGEWRAVRSGELGPGSTARRAFVVTETNAYEMTVDRIDEAKLVGRPTRAWELPGDPGHGVLAYPSEKPEAIARHRGWREVAAQPSIELGRESVKHATIYDRHRGRTVAAIVAGSIVGVVVLFLGVVAVACSRGGCLGG